MDKWLEEEHKKLQEEFEFIANANVGCEFMDEEDKQRVKEIAKREWIRYFDNTIGLSRAELKRITKTETLPAKEYLLSDKPEQIIQRSYKEIQEYKKFGFKIDIAENLYNYGEIYNLTIPKGTLTPEEFFKIQEHVIMTIKMLEQLNFP